MYMTMTNLTQLEHHPLSMSFEESGRKKRKGYQYVPDIPVEEPPLPAKRERKKVQYNDYVNPVKAIRKSPTRKRSPVRKYTKKTQQRPGKKQKVSSDSEEQEQQFLQSLTDKKRELEEKLLQINADLADVTEKLSVGKDSESEPEAEKDVNDLNNNDEDNEVDKQDDEVINKKQDKNDSVDEKDSNDVDEEMKEENKEEEAENDETTETSKKPAKKPAKKTKRRRSAATKKKKETKARSPDSKRTPRVTKIPEVLSPSELQAANKVAFTKILNTLMKHRYALPFLEPVDPVALNIPDYPLIIKNPMDFGTIKKKLENEEYSTPKDFADDVTLVFNNACTYNQPGSDVFIMATTIEEVFIKKMNPLLTKQGFPSIVGNHPNLPPMLQTRSVLYQSIAPSAGYSELKKSVDSLRKELQNLRSLENKVVTPKAPVKVEAPVPMTRDEKRRLSNDINKLPSEHLGVIVKIIKQKMPIGDVEEIVIDIDSLDTVTLRELEQYVLKVKRKGSRRGRPNNHKNNNNNPLTAESKLEIAKKSEELTAQRLEDVQKRLDELRKSAHARNSILTNSTTISFANPLDDLPFDEAMNATLSPHGNEKKEDQSESESESGSDTDSDASSSGSGSDNESASESDSENPPNQ